MTYPQSPGMAWYGRIFGAPVRFGQNANRLIFDQDTTKLPLSNSDAGLCEALEEHARQILGGVTCEDRLLATLHGVLRDTLNGGVGLDRAARSLGMSRRTLQRKLAERGLSFRRVLDDVRLARCRSLMSEEGWSALAACEVLGFSEPSAFYRAFRRWTGVSPRRYLH